MTQPNYCVEAFTRNPQPTPKRPHWTYRFYTWADHDAPYGWLTFRDGEFMDAYASEELARAYVNYKNR